MIIDGHKMKKYIIALSVMICFSTAHAIEIEFTNECEGGKVVFTGKEIILGECYSHRYEYRNIRLEYALYRPFTAPVSQGVINLPQGDDATKTTFALPVPRHIKNAEWPVESKYILEIRLLLDEKNHKPFIKTYTKTLLRTSKLDQRDRYQISFKGLDLSTKLEKINYELKPIKKPSATQSEQG